MASSVGSVGGPRGTRRTRRRRAEDVAPASAPGPAEALDGIEPAAPIPPGAPGPQHAAPAVEAQLIGQTDSAEGADPAKGAVCRAHGEYLKAEWSGPYDRRTRRGRIAKTDV